MPTLLLTGATGRLGTYLLPSLIEQGWKIKSIGRTDPQIAGVEWISCDLLKDLPSAGLAQGCEALLHFANLSKVAPERDLEVASWLFREAQASGVASFFYASSIRVYGPLLGKVTEQTQPQPQVDDVYGCSKLKIERELSELAAQGSGPSLKILRVGHVVGLGAESDPPLLPSRRQLLLLGSAYVHWIHIRDFCRAVLFLLEKRQHSKPDCFNLTSDFVEGKVMADFYGGSSLVLGGGVSRRVAYEIFKHRPRGRESIAARIEPHNLGALGFRSQVVELREYLTARTARRTSGEERLDP